MKKLITILFCWVTGIAQSQTISSQRSSIEIKKFTFGAQAGLAYAYEDKSNLWHTSVSFTAEYHLKNHIFVQLAPQYTWLWRWNEHYLTLPIHLRKQWQKLSLFAGPAITFDVGYFADLGISAGAYYHLGKHSALALSIFSFTLYDYHIDYLYVPVHVSYRFTF